MVSVIIPNYCHAQYLRERIDSVLSQTYKDFEVIILDDCSTDNSREVIESYRGREHVAHIIYNEQNSGSPFKQWQKGVELAKGEYIWIAESDDVAYDTLMEECVKALDANKEASLAFVDCEFIDGESKHTGFTDLNRKLAHRKSGNTTINGSGDYFFAFFGTHDHYRRSGIVSIRSWEKYFGKMYQIYEGTHFMEEEHINALLVPKICEILKVSL